MDMCLPMGSRDYAKRLFNWLQSPTGMASSELGSPGAGREHRKETSSFLPCSDLLPVSHRPNGKPLSISGGVEKGRERNWEEEGKMETGMPI